MPSERTFVTEVATGLGMLWGDDPASVITRRPSEMSNLSDADWDRLAGLWRAGTFEADFVAGFRNGRAFLRAPGALRDRPPRSIEWTGGRRPPGDEVVPSDLRVDHVYLVSCKYLSRILHNPSPARLVDGLLARTPVDDDRDWYQRTAPVEHQQLYERCASSVPSPLPADASDLTSAQRRQLALALRGDWPPGAREAYTRLCRAVADVTARRWRARITPANAETVLWRLLRIGSAPYFILGTGSRGSMRLRVDTPWDWRQSFRLVGLRVEAQEGGQPRVGWSADYEDRRSGTSRTVGGHVEIRWSHGRFGQPPEAKVYLDGFHEDVPGYHPL